MRFVSPSRTIERNTVVLRQLNAVRELQHCNMARWKYKAPPVTFDMQYALRVAPLLSYMEVYGSVDWEIVDESLGFEPD